MTISRSRHRRSIIFRRSEQVQDTAKALSDFLDGCDKIEPAYQQQATAEFCAVIAAYFNKHNRG